MNFKHSWTRVIVTENTNNLIKYVDFQITITHFLFSHDKLGLIWFEILFRSPLASGPPAGKVQILLTMYKCVNGSAPDYLCELISSYTPARRLRSLSQSLAVQPKVASKTYGERSFSFMGPFLWNSLPTWIRTFI